MLPVATIVGDMVILITLMQKNDKAGEHSWIIGGGAYHASDKIIQHNGCGTVNVSTPIHRFGPIITDVPKIINFYAEDYGKVYRSCGNVSIVMRVRNLLGATA